MYKSIYISTRTSERSAATAENASNGTPNESTPAPGCGSAAL